MCRDPDRTTITGDADARAAVTGRGLRTARWLVGWVQRGLRPRRLLLSLLGLTALAAGYGWVAEYQAWRAALRHQGFVDEMVPPASSDRIVVFAPHPDDELLGCGGVIQEALENGARVDVVLMTNGDASELALIFGEKEVFVSPEAFVGLGRSRQEESLRALRAIGLPESQVHFLSYPNNGLTQLWRPAHWLYQDCYRSPYTRASSSPYRRSVTPQAPYCGQQVLTDVLLVLQQLRPNKVFLPHPKDVHPDHWATVCFVEYALATIAVRGDAWAAESERFGYLVHWPRFPAPARVSPRQDLLPPADLTGESTGWLRLELSAAVARSKLRAIRSYASQMPEFDRFLLKFARANETFERLGPCTIALGKRTRWQDRGGRRKSLGGADIEALELTLRSDGRASANLANSGRELKRRSYLALDLRGWDVHGAPEVIEVQVGPHGRVHAVRLSSNALASGGVVCYPHEAGLTVNFRVPRELLGRRGFFLSCWGSVKDRSVDSVLVAPVHSSSS